VTIPTRALAAACCAFLGSATARAQPVEQPQGRIQLGSAVSITPAVVIVTGRDSNAVRTAIGQPASEIYGVPQMESWIGRGRVRLNLANAVEFSRQRSQDGSYQPNVNQYHLGRLDLGGRRLGVQAVASHRDHYAPPTDFDGFERGLRSRRIERELGATVRVRPGGRLSFNGFGNRSVLRYDADVRYQGVSLEQNLNRNIFSFGGDAQVSFTALTSAGVSVVGYRDRFLFAPDRDGDGVRVSALAEFSPAALVAGRAEVGFLRYQTKLTGDRFGGPAYNVGLTFNRSSLLLDVSGRRAIEFSFDPGKGFYVSNGLDAFSVLRFATIWEAFGRGSIRVLDPRGRLAENEPTRYIQEYKFGVARRFGDSTRIGADFERYKTSGGGGFSGVRTTVFFTYGTTRLLRLDRPLPGGF